MGRKTLLIGGLLVAAALAAAFGWRWYTAPSALAGPEVLANARAATAAQREDLVPTHTAERPAPPPNPLGNLYFGDLHVHTSLSFDSYLFGNRFDLDDAYRFANGAPLTLATGETARLAVPLDFVALTDHAESFAVEALCGAPERLPQAEAICQGMDNPSRQTFLRLRDQGTRRPMQRGSEFCPEGMDCIALEDSTWARIAAAADRHNQPGQFTAFIAYEYSPPLPERGKQHRNVVFRGSQVPSHATSAFDAASAIDLWRALERDCTGACEVLTIPHNMNRSWSLAYSDRTIDGDPYARDDWALRARSEPIAEVYQIKGASECAMGVGSTDEECAFEQWLAPCADGETRGCASTTGFARQGLKRGLELRAELGFNPLRFGLVAATDTHNATPGDTEEWDYRGSVNVITSPASRRLAAPQMDHNAGVGRSPGGLTAIWAPENTRDALFTAMQRREVYATSGTRIRLRFYAGPDLPNDLTEAADPVVIAAALGVPMGAQLPAGPRAPRLYVAAARDPFSAPLQSIQVVKGWLDADGTHERVVDIACADGLTPDALGRCPDNGATVDRTTCQASDDKGAAELSATWVDPDYQPGQAAFYYVRVLENPSCRWSTWDALRTGTAPRDDVPATLQERAWSSPIWVGGV